MKKGSYPTTITYLEMLEKPSFEKIEFPNNTEVKEISNIPIHFYRYLYNTVGEPWLWYERRKIDDEELSKRIHKDNLGIYLLYVNNIPAGYVEIDFSSEDVNLVYFGLIPDFIGKGYGKFFLTWSMEKAWSKNTKRVWVHTCTLDAPNAIETYKKMGFIPFKKEEVIHIID